MCLRRRLDRSPPVLQQAVVATSPEMIEHLASLEDLGRHAVQLDEVQLIHL
jgi:hypothetical protein